jgi:hypothetical protein
MLHKLSEAQIVGTTTESQIVGMLKRLGENSGLELSIDHKRIHTLFN